MHRLNFNHLWMKALTGYLLHPSIPTDKNDLRIIDVGAGTGYYQSGIRYTKVLLIRASIEYGFPNWQQHSQALLSML